LTGVLTGKHLAALRSGGAGCASDLRHRGKLVRAGRGSHLDSL